MKETLANLERRVLSQIAAMRRDDWRSRGLCAAPDFNMSLFEPPNIAYLEPICSRCPVKLECLTTLVVESDYEENGAGMTPDARKEKYQRHAGARSALYRQALGLVAPKKKPKAQPPTPRQEKRERAWFTQEEWLAHGRILLTMIAEAPLDNPLIAQDLVKQSGYNQTHVSRLTRKMEAWGWVTRKLVTAKVKGGRRPSGLVLTERGSEELDLGSDTS